MRVIIVIVVAVENLICIVTVVIVVTVCTFVTVYKQHLNVTIIIVTILEYLLIFCLLFFFTRALYFL